MLSKAWMLNPELTSYSQKNFVYILAGLIIWLAALSIYLVKTVRHYRRLARGANNLDLGQILDSNFKKIDLLQKSQEQVLGDLAQSQKLNRRNFQKFALVRFNPFEDTGGNQSFAVALLDGENNGLVISSLHSRAGTRVYAKQVAQGGPGEHQFSREEKEVVEKAAQSKN